jgi:pyruvate, water dikinase
MISTATIGWFKDIGLDDRIHVGGKGGSLGELTRAGIAVPPGFVIKTRAFERFLDALDRELQTRTRMQSLDPQDVDVTTKLCSEMRQRLECAALPTDVLNEVSSAYEALFAGGAVSPVAVRSSATTEDAADASFAGLQETYLWVTNEQQMLTSVRSCWASLYSVESVTYRRQRGVPEDAVAMAVVVQKMVNARSAGVMFTRSPLTGDRSVIALEGSWGLGSAVVGGEVTPDRWVIGKITGEISVREISDKNHQHLPAAKGGIQSVPVPDELRRAPSLSDEEIEALRTIARKVERYYGRAQDIEWAVERETNSILLLQSRPETVWSVKEAQSVTRPADDPLLHVMTIFGGKR